MAQDTNIKQDTIQMLLASRSFTTGVPVAKDLYFLYFAKKEVE